MNMCICASGYIYNICVSVWLSLSLFVSGCVCVFNQLMVTWQGTEESYEISKVSKPGA